jgi:hypothetical protein
MKCVWQFGLVLLVLAGASPLPAQALHPGGAPKKAAPKGEMKKGLGPNRLNAPNGAIERLLAMPPEQRDRVLEKLPPAQQANFRRRFEQFDRRPPEERARLLKLWERMESLTPERREVLTRQMQAFNAVADERRLVLRRALNQLSRLTPEERAERLASPPFKRRFSATELQMLSDLAENYPFPAR